MNAWQWQNRHGDLATSLRSRHLSPTPHSRSDDQITQLLSQLQGMDDTQLERLMRVAGWTQWGLKMLKRYALVLVLLFLGAALLLGYSIKWLLRKNPSAALAEDPAVVSAVEAPVDVAGGDAALGGVGSADGFVSDEM